jgi:hypothetical protein
MKGDNQGAMEMLAQEEPDSRIEWLPKSMHVKNVNLINPSDTGSFSI